MFKADSEEMDKTEGAGPGEMSRNATAQEDTTADWTEGIIPDELLREPAIKESAAEEVDETAVQEDITTDVAIDHDLEKILESAKGNYEAGLEIHESAEI